MHGLSSRGTDFEPLGSLLVSYGFATLAWNLRGQGLDPEISRRGSFLDIGGMLQDLEAFADFCARRYPGVPLLLCGDSMGALLAIRAVVTVPLAQRFEGVILIVPVVDLAQKNPEWLKAILRMVAKVLPQFRLPPSLFVHGKRATPILTRVPERQRYVETAPHRLDTLTLPFLLNMAELIETSHLSASRIRLPTLVLYGGQDVFVRPNQVEAFVERLGAPDRTHRFYPDAYHQLLFDLDRDAVLSDIVAWLDDRFPGSRG